MTEPSRKKSQYSSSESRGRVGNMGNSELLSKIVGYLENTGANDEYIESFIASYDAGISSVWLNSMLKETIPNPEGKKRMDYSMFKSIERLLLSWDGNSKLEMDDDRDLKVFIFMINSAGEAAKFGSGQRVFLPKTIANGELSRLLDIREEVDEYGINTVLSHEDIQRILESEHNRLRPTEEEMAHIVYFDPNTIREEQQLTIDDVAKFIFEADRMENHPPPINFKTFSFSEDENVGFITARDMEKKLSNAYSGAAPIQPNTVPRLSEEDVIKVIHDVYGEPDAPSSRRIAPFVVSTDRLKKSRKQKPEGEQSSDEKNTREEYRM